MHPLQLPLQKCRSLKFEGLISYYGKFIKNFSTKLNPLYNLLHKDKAFCWTEIEQEAFESIKLELINSKVLTNFKGSYPLIIEVDASPVGVGCVLLQNIRGKDKPIYFASKKLSPAEQNYSQIDREGLALVFAVKKFKYFLLGRKFTARTDHKPLLSLFGPGKPIPDTNARLQRWALLLSQFTFDLEHKPGKDNIVADALSRLPVDDKDHFHTPVEYINLVENLSFQDFSFDNIKKATAKDPVMSHLVRCLKFN